MTPKDMSGAIIREFETGCDEEGYRCRRSTEDQLEAVKQAFAYLVQDLHRQRITDDTALKFCPNWDVL